MKRWKLVLTSLMAAAYLGSGCAQAQGPGDYPNHPIRIIVPFGAGGVTDVLARVLGKEIGKDFGQPVVVENVVGATSIIGTHKVARAEPDGYTLLLTSNAFTINPALRKTLPFDPIKDFTPITLLAASPNMLVVRSDSPYDTVAKYIAAAKAAPGKITFAFSGIGTSLHIAGEQFSLITGTHYNAIPYAASNQSVQAVLGGQTDSSWSAVNSALPFVQNKRLKALAIATDKRSSFVPDVPTFSELGIKGMKSETWLALLGPAHLPQPIAIKLDTELKKLLARPDIQEKIVSLGAEPVGTELDKFGAQIREEIAMYQKIVKSAGITPN